MKKNSYMVGEIIPPTNFGIYMNGEKLSNGEICNQLIDYDKMVRKQYKLLKPIIDVCHDYNISIKDIIDITIESIENSTTEWEIVQKGRYYTVRGGKGSFNFNNKKEAETLTNLLNKGGY